MRTPLGLSLVWTSGLCVGLGLAWLREKPEPESSVVIEYRDIPRSEEEFPLVMPTTATVEEMKARLATALEENKRLTAPYAPSGAEGASYLTQISEESYHEDDDYDKSVVEIFRSDSGDHVIVDGTEDDNWQHTLGADLLDIMVGMTGIYVRNENLKTDFEVGWGQP